MKSTKLNQKQKNKRLFFFLFCLTVIGFRPLYAQVLNNSTIYVKDGSSVYVKSGIFTFGSSSITKTERGSNFGKMIFGSAASTTGTASGGTLFTDGYASTLSTSFFLLPVGQGSIYAPVGILNSTLTNGVHAAYVGATPTNSGNINTNLLAISGVEYWLIKGDNSKISLTWNLNSSVSSLVSNLQDLTITGYNITNSRWESIPSVADATSILGGISSLSTGSITTNNNVILANYSAFTLAKLGSSCPEIVASSGLTRTFDGTSWDFQPALGDNAVISAEGNPGSFVCNSLVLNANVNLTGTQSIDIVNGVTGSGKIIMSSQASVVQRATGFSGPSIELTKTTNAMNQYGYIYWGSPLTTDAFSQLNAAQASTASSASAFDSMYKYVSGDISATGGWQPLSTLEIGGGFITRVKPQAPFTSSVATDVINLKFLGVANNGTIDKSVAVVSGDANSGRNYNLLGNPYPSAIDADKFLLENSNELDGAIYIWKSQTPNDGITPYSAADYITYTRAGSTSTGSGAASFSGKIATGQGFKVKAIANGTIQFTNCMRMVTNNTQFNRDSAAESNTKDRYKLNMTNTSGIFSQILVAYLPETTLGYDQMYDAELNSVSPAQLYSVFEGDGRKLAINARPPFVDTDVVNLGTNKTGTDSESFSIAISEREGVFATNAVNVFLFDTLLNVYHNLANGAYNFNTNTTELNNRFQVVYQKSALNSVDFESNQVVATINENMLTIQSKLTMNLIEIYDISGRMVTSFIAENEKSINKPFHFSDGIYIAKIQLNNGVITTQKLIKK